MRFLIFALLLAASPVAFSQDFAPPPVHEYGDRLDRIYDATVRVSVSGGTGTGTIYKEDDQFYYILTNAHVATSNKVGLEFTKNHYPSPRYQGEVILRVLRSGVDVAAVRVAKSALPAGIALPVIPLATSEEVVKELFLVTSGCQAGERPSIQNTITTRDTSNLIYYLPTSRPGRSGSALIARDGKTIQGLVAWMTDRGASSEGLAMKIDVIRPLLEGQNTQVAFDDFPNDAVEIPLGSGELVETEVSALRECPADSCLDDNCPWDLEYISTFPAKDDPWRKRFGGPQTPQPKQEAKPQAPASPDNPWASPRPQQPSPQQPSPQQPEKERPRLFDSEREFGRLFERFDKLEPKIDRLGEDLKKRQDEELEEAHRRQRLLDRIDRLPDKLIGPDDLNQFAERQSTTLIERIRNAIWTLLQPVIWAWWIALTLGITWALNMILSPIFGANWFAIILLWIVGIGRKAVSGVLTAWKAARQPLEAKPVKKPRKPRAKKPAEKADE
jgi:uncharacterized protein YdcH (DUF465 family)